MNPIQLAIQELGSASALARAINVTPQAVCFWRDGRRKTPAEQCAAIERATGGAVTRKDLRPDDWHRIWPELVTHEPVKDAAHGEPA
ncbi:helix-turn-helix domain-containing protein [Pusillimonas sp. SM2304]|uniref:transcriptional regulator n=1 Tax=Pusillimonas sp. SM2304 TaxID=3073241 RepID=UPI002875E467|nr:helix-turn-helix domain-containing protein [Pusillimonas sp. SM2304]MDS1141738.1 helix-turn-helix domain-containing protein [Pusillimonas sp. SM2304]